MHSDLDHLPARQQSDLRRALDVLFASFEEATEALESAGRTFRVAYVSYHSTAVGAAVLAGLAVSVLPESAVRPGMRILGPSDGFPALPSCKIGLIRTRGEENPLADALGFHIKQSLDNLGATRTVTPLAAE